MVKHYNRLEADWPLFFNQLSGEYHHCTLLHSHLPFVKHPSYSEKNDIIFEQKYLEEGWFFEGIIYCYVPLIIMIKDLAKNGINSQLTINLTPTLLEMMNDKYLMEKCLWHLNKLIKMSEKEIKRTSNYKNFNQYQNNTVAPDILTKDVLKNLNTAARHYNETFIKIKKELLDNKLNLINVFKKLQDDGLIEIIASSATHAYTPLLKEDYMSKMQIGIGVEAYKKYFNKKPKGFWLPECGYYPGVEDLLKDFELDYTFLNTTAVMFSETKSDQKINKIYKNNDFSFFVRNNLLSGKVWDAKGGYPGNGDYRENYRDIGYDLKYNYIKDCLFETVSGNAHSIGIKYHRITDKKISLDQKEFYDMNQALKKTKQDANEYIELIKNKSSSDTNDIFTLSFDTELFGHWWYEGVNWLKEFIIGMNKNETVQIITPSQLQLNDSNSMTLRPANSSWGFGFFNEQWCNIESVWYYPALSVINKMIRNNIFKIQDKNRYQLYRELFLYQSSDWVFMIANKHCVDYAIKRTKKHYKRIMNMFNNDSITQDYNDDTIFPDLPVLLRNMESRIGNVFANNQKYNSLIFETLIVDPFQSFMFFIDESDNESNKKAFIFRIKDKVNIDDEIKLDELIQKYKNIMPKLEYFHDEELELSFNYAYFHTYPNERYLSVLVDDNNNILMKFVLDTPNGLPMFFDSDGKIILKYNRNKISEDLKALWGTDTNYYDVDTLNQLSNKIDKKVMRHLILKKEIQDNNYRFNEIRGVINKIIFEDEGELLPLKPNLLDAGCGNGLFMHIANVNNWQVNGIDLNKEKLAKPVPMVKDFLKYGSILDNDIFEKKMFDIVVCNHVLEHIEECSVEKAILNLTTWTNNWLYLEIPTDDRYPDHVTVKPEFWWFSTIGRILKKTDDFIIRWKKFEEAWGLCKFIITKKQSYISSNSSDKKITVKYKGILCKLIGEDTKIKFSYFNKDEIIKDINTVNHISYDNNELTYELPHRDGCEGILYYFTDKEGYISDNNNDVGWIEHFV